jgi:tripartite-type tricarboxylate transporter receptor subunit TctC
MRIMISAMVGALLFAAGMPVPQALAQSYPTRPVRIIASTPAGGPQDLLARHVAQYLSAALGQPFLVENRVGANTIIAAQAAADAPPDGHTLLIGSDATLSINPLLHARLPYDADGFIPITLLAALEQPLFVNEKLPVNSLADFIAYAKARPGQLSYSSIGVGSTPHLATERFLQATGLQLVHIPYKGASEVLPALVADQVQMSIVALMGALPLIQAKTIKALVTSGAKRVPEMPDVPTFAEAGYPQLDFKVWFGLVARKGTPQAIIDRLAELSDKYVSSDEFRNVLAARYRWTPLGGSQQDFAAFLKRDRETYRQAIELAKIQKSN